MELLRLTEPQNRVDYFQRGILLNLQYWQGWVGQKITDIDALDRERDNILRAVSYAFDLTEAWLSVRELIQILSSYMERRGHWEIWHQVLDRAVKTAQRNDDATGEVNLSALLARLSFQQSRFKEAVSSYRQTLRLARQIGDLFNEGRACTNLGYHYIEQGYWYRAEVLCCHALKLFEQINSGHGRAHTENHLGILYTRQHRWERALRHLEQACTIWQMMADDHGLMFGLINLGLIYLRMEQPVPALDYFEKALDQAKLTGEARLIGIIYMNMGLAYTLDGNFAEGEAYARQAETILEQFLDTIGLAQVWDNLGMVCLYQGKEDEAVSYLTTSLDMWRRLKNEKGEVETLVDMIKYELTIGNPQQAAIRLNEVERLIERNNALKYRYLQSRLDKYRRSLTEHTSQSTTAV